MTKINTLALVRARVRLQCLASGRLFSGWVARIRAGQAVINLKPGTEATVGTVFTVEVHGVAAIATFQAQALAVQGQQLVLAIPSTCSTREPTEKPRLLVKDVFGSYAKDGRVVQVRVLDLSQDGFGVISPEEEERGAQLPFTFEAYGEIILATGDVRYCRAVPDSPNEYRLGLRLEMPNRIHRAKWTSLFQRTVDDAAGG